MFLVFSVVPPINCLKHEEKGTREAEYIKLRCKWETHDFRKNVAMSEGSRLCGEDSVQVNT
jgi:hypothetical protein